MLKKIIAVLMILSMVLPMLSIEVLASDTEMGNIGFESWNSAYSESCFRVNDVSGIGNYMVSEKLYGSDSKAFHIGNDEGAQTQYGGVLGAKYSYINFSQYTDTTLDGTTYKYKTIAFDVAVDSLKSSMSVTVKSNSDNSTTRYTLFSISNGVMKSANNSVTLVSSVEAKRWYNIKMVESYDGSLGNWKFYVDDQLCGTSTSFKATKLTEMWFNYFTNTDTYQDENGNTKYYENGFALDNINIKNSDDTEEPVYSYPVLDISAGYSTKIEVKNAFPRHIKVKSDVNAYFVENYLTGADSYTVVDESSTEIEDDASAIGNYLRVVKGEDTYVYPIGLLDDYIVQKTHDFNNWTGGTYYNYGSWRVSGFSNNTIPDYYSNSLKYGSSNKSITFTGNAGTYGYFKDVYSDITLTNINKYFKLSFDVAVSSDASALSVIADSARTKTLMSISNGKLKLLGNTQKLMDIKAKQWYRIDLIEEYAYDTATWSAYVNGVKIFDGYESFAYTSMTANYPRFVKDSGVGDDFSVDNIDFSVSNYFPSTENEDFKLYTDLNSNIAIKNDFSREIILYEEVSSSELIDSLTNENIEASVVDENGALLSEEVSIAGNYAIIVSGDKEYIYHITLNTESEYFVFYDNDFSSSFNGLTINKKNAQIAKTNEYISVQPSQSSDSYFELNSFVAEAGFFVVDFSLCGKSNSNGTMQLMLRNETTTETVTANCAIFKGNVLTVGGDTIYTAKDGEWFDVTIAVNLSNGRVSAYIGGELVKDNMNVGKNLKQVTLSRFYFTAGVGEYCIDNLKIYNSDTVGNTQNLESAEISPFKSKKYSQIALKNRIAVETNVSSAWNGTDKIYLDYPVHTSEGNIYLAISDAEKLFDSVGAAEWTDTGIGYVNILTTAQNNGYEYSENGKGLCVFDQNSAFPSSSQMDYIHRYLMFRRYTPEKLASVKINTNQRLLTDAGRFDEIIESCTTNEFMQSRYSTVISNANSYLNREILSYTLSSDGKLLAVSTEFRNRILTLLTAYKLTNNVDYKNRATAELNSVLTFDDWNAGTHFLDAAEMAFGVALYYDWLRDELTTNQKENIENKINEYFLNYSYSAYNTIPSPFWVSTKTNWSSVVNGTAAICAMALWETDVDRYSEILTKAIRACEDNIYLFLPDGAWHEGGHYWAYTMEFLSYLYSSLDVFFGETLDLEKSNGFRNTGYFAIGIDAPQGMNDYHDGFVTHINTSALFYLGNKFNDDNLTKAKLFFDNMYSTSVKPEDLLWYDADVILTSLDLPTDYYFREAESVTMREQWQKDTGAYVAFHGGNNTGDHYHTDAGAFVFDLNGERWALDIPLKSYIEDNSFARSLQGHNTLEIFAATETSGAQSASENAEVTEFETGYNSAYAVLDMTKLYSNAESVKRGYYLRNNRRVLEICDKVDVAEESTVVWRMNTEADVTITDNGATLTKKGKTVYLTFASDCPAEISLNSSLELPEAYGNSVKQIEIHLSVSDVATLNVIISENKKTDFTDILEWEIDEPDVEFLNGDFEYIYKHPSDVVIVSNLSDKNIIAASFSGDRMVEAVEIEKSDKATFNSGNIIKIFNWDENLCPLSQHIVFD